MKSQLAQLSAVIRQTHGRDVAVYDETFLTKALEKRVAATAGQDAAAYLGRLAHDRPEAEAFFDSLHIGYSELFRDPLAFALLEQRVLPSLIAAAEHAGRPEIRVWSAGCAGGQEAWSVAMLLDELLTARKGPVSFRVIATDVAEAELAAAWRGVYDEAAVRNVRQRHLNAYFTREDESYILAARLRDRVDFSLHNLLDAGTTCPPASIYGDFDLVLCSNLLLYYRPETQRLILDKLWRCLSSSGYLMTGEAERAMVQKAGGFRAVAPPAAVFQTTAGRKAP
jgi:chemotaxis protein methyltransferase CheR